MKNDLKEFCLSAFIVLICVLLGFTAGYKYNDHFRDDTQKVDTLIVEKWDTIRIEKPTEIVRTIIRYDTLTKTEFVNITDSALLRKIDSLNLEISIPIEQIVYRDSTQSARYEAFVSGYHAALDSIHINCLQTTTIIKEFEKQRRFGIGVQVGVGYAGKLTPYVGIGAHYRLW